MNDFLAWLDVLAQQHPMWAYGVLFLSAVVENLFPPVPGDTVTVFGAYLVGRDALSLWPVIISTFLGSALGFMALFWFGYHYGRGFILKLRWVKPDHMDRAEALVRRKGLAAVAVNRFLPGLRSVISISAGTMRLHPWRVAVATSVSAFCWNGLLIWLGFLFGDNWQQVMDAVGQLNRAVLGLLAVVAIFVGIYLYRRKKARREAEDEVSSDRRADAGEGKETE